MQALQAELWLRTFLDYRLFTLGNSAVRVSTFLVLLLVLVAAYWASRGIQRAIRRVLRTRGFVDVGTTELVLRLVHYGIMGVAIAVGLQTVGIELAALFAAGAIFAIAVRFAMQNIAENFVSGLILVGERSIKPGDATGLESALNEAVWYALKEQGITIAFPQLDVHLDPGIEKP